MVVLLLKLTKEAFDGVWTQAWQVYNNLKSEAQTTVPHVHWLLQSSRMDDIYEKKTLEDTVLSVLNTIISYVHFHSTDMRNVVMW